MIYIGKKVRRPLTIGGTTNAVHENDNTKFVTVWKDGTVCYIHPDYRFYSVEFNLHGTKVRESYMFEHKDTKQQVDEIYKLNFEQVKNKDVFNILRGALQTY